ncbi:uncharacterized protein FYW61_014723 [Anableps anableps]
MKFGENSDLEHHPSTRTVISPNPIAPRTVVNAAVTPHTAPDPAISSSSCVRRRAEVKAGKILELLASSWVVPGVLLLSPCCCPHLDLISSSAATPNSSAR